MALTTRNKTPSIESSLFKTMLEIEDFEVGLPRCNRVAMIGATGSLGGLTFIFISVPTRKDEIFVKETVGHTAPDRRLLKDLLVCSISEHDVVSSVGFCGGAITSIHFHAAGGSVAFATASPCRVQRGRVARHGPNYFPAPWSRYCVWDCFWWRTPQPVMEPRKLLRTDGR